MYSFKNLMNQLNVFAQSDWLQKQRAIDFLDFAKKGLIQIANEFLICHILGIALNMRCILIQIWT